MEVIEKSVKVYIDVNGQRPYVKWFYLLRDTRAKQKIQARLGRLRLGNFGETRSLGEGVFELKINFGPGYRIYFGHINNKIILLLLGGDKSTQENDINKAKEHWKDYKKEKKDANW